MKFYMLDNHDSFVYNLVAYFRELHQEIVVKNIQDADLTKIESEKYHGIILSPGPGTPEQATVTREIMRLYAGKIPILGVCLGHQVIAFCYGAQVIKGKQPMHGKLSHINHTGKRLFENIINNFQVTRYHSLIIDPSTLPEEFVIDAVSEDYEIMAISHRYQPIYGVQFHPEAVLSEFGHDLIHNFIRICELWEKQHDSHKKM